MNGNIKILLSFFAALLIALFSITAGSAGISLKDIVLIIKDIVARGEVRSGLNSAKNIVLNLRFPRALLAFFSGGAIGISGAVLQSMLRNPLASPYIMGVSSGASLGAGLIMVTGFTLPFAGAWTLPLFGFIFALGTVFFVVAFSSSFDKTISNNTVILFGMVFSLFINAILTLLVALFREELKTLIIWQMGSFSMKGWAHIKMIIPFTVAGIILVLMYSKEMDILTFGDDEALSFGVDVKSIKKILFMVSALLSGVAVSLSGTIGFVDLIAPHISRKIVGSKHKYVLPESFIVGGILMMVSDLIARTVVSPSELPVGSVTALIGAPFFAWIYFRPAKQNI
jgi:iron complex transport system permease protein